MDMAFKASQPDIFSCRALPPHLGKNKTLTRLGFPLRLRSHQKSLKVEKHLPDESELRPLLKDSIDAGSADRVYSTLQKLGVLGGRLSATTGELIVSWLTSSTATREGTRKWSVQLARVDEFGVCGGCGEKLTTVDLDQAETESLARAVAAVAGARDSSFQRFQKWLDYYGPFEAVVDAANVGLVSQKRFSLSKTVRDRLIAPSETITLLVGNIMKTEGFNLGRRVNRVVNAVRQKLPSKTWPLVIVHNRRISGKEMENPRTAKLMEKLKNANALYATPTGSNDDWYWLYAAIKSRGLIVTNDEMRDHSFQLLGNDNFSKWKERHQVHLTFNDGSPAILMPSSCFSTTQESERGNWHVPITGQTMWLCITRDGETKEVKRENSQGDSQTEFHRKSLSRHGVLTDETILFDIEEAEKIYGCIIDFQI